MSTTQILIVFLALINLVTFVAYGIDKYKAKHKKWRIPEKNLILLALCGGSVGALLGMKVWHHKTKHRLFYIGVPAILILQVAAAIYLLL